MRGGLLLLLPSTWSACPDHQGVPKWFMVSIGETMIGQKEGPRLRPWTIFGHPADHPTPNNGELVDSPWQEDTLAIRLKQLLISAIILDQHRTLKVPDGMSLIDVSTRVSWRLMFSRLSISISRCNYGMVPLGTGVAYCAGEEWSEVLLTIMRLMFILIDWAIIRRYWKVLECGEAVALLVGGEEQFNGWLPFFLSGNCLVCPLVWWTGRYLLQ